MRARVRQKALRLITSQLIASDFSASDLRDIAYELRSGSLGDDIFFLLEGFYHQLSRDDAFKNSEPQSDELLDFVQRKRVSKKALFDMMQQIDGFRYAGVSTEMTAREMVMHFLDWANPEQVRTFYALLDVNDPKDPYLSGIMNRK